MRKLFFCVICALALVACKKDYSGPLDTGRVVTGEAINVTSTSATVVASFYPVSSFYKYKTRMLCSTDSEPMPGHDLVYTFWVEDTKVYFSYTDLQPGTTYYYRGLMEYNNYMDGKLVYGETKSFVTLPDV